MLDSLNLVRRRRFIFFSLNVRRAEAGSLVLRRTRLKLVPISRETLVESNWLPPFVLFIPQFILGSVMDNVDEPVVGRRISCECDTIGEVIETLEKMMPKLKQAQSKLSNAETGTCKVFNDRRVDEDQIKSLVDKMKEMMEDVCHKLKEHTTWHTKNARTSVDTDSAYCGSSTQSRILDGFTLQAFPELPESQRASTLDLALPIQEETRYDEKNRAIGQKYSTRPKLADLKQEEEPQTFEHPPAQARQIVIPEHTIRVQRGTATIPEQTVTLPGGMVTIREQTVTIKGGTVTVPERTVLLQEVAVTIPQKTITIDEGDIIIPEETVPITRGKVVVRDPDGPHLSEC